MSTSSVPMFTTAALNELKMRQLPCQPHHILLSSSQKHVTHSTSLSKPSFSSSSESPRSSGTDQSPNTKRLHNHRNITAPISILIETEVITECYRCGPGKSHSHGEKCYSDDVIVIDCVSGDRSSPFTDRRNVRDTTKPPVRNTALHTYLHGRTESPKRQQANGDPALGSEVQNLAASRAKLEFEVKEYIEFLRVLQERRERIAAKGEKLPRSVSPESETSRRSSPSAARRACQEAYAKMTPTERHLMRDKLHWDGIRRRDLKREEEERLDWSQYEHTGSSLRADKSIPNGEEEEKRRAQQVEDGVQDLKSKFHAKEQRQQSESWELYENGWKGFFNLSSTTSSGHPAFSLTFIRIPWPILNVFLTLPDVSETANDALFDTIFSPETISSFLFSTHHHIKEKYKRQRLHDALLRYHPDRFENHVLCFIEEGERMVTKLAMNRVAGVLSSMLNDVDF